MNSEPNASMCVGVWVGVFKRCSILSGVGLLSIGEADEEGNVEPGLKFPVG